MHLPRLIPKSLSVLLTVVLLLNTVPSQSIERIPQAPKSVFYIRDIHRNLDAQKNIAQTISRMSGQTDLVALEGAFGPLDFELFDTYPYSESVRSAASSMLLKLSLSGPVFAALTQPKKVPFIGVDDKALYRKNRLAYTSAFPYKRANQAALRRMQDALNSSKQIEYSRRLYDFDQVVRQFHSHRLSLLDFVSKLNRSSGSLDDRRFPQLTKLLRASRLEHFVDAKRSKLSQAYLALLKNLDGEILYTEIENAEASIYGELIRTASEKTLFEKDQALQLCEKLFSFSLGPKDWDRYVASNAGEPISRFPGKIYFEEFYRAAKARDIAMSRNVVRAIRQTGAQRVVLVTGGFHSSGVETQLTQADISVIPYVPRVSHLNENDLSGYLRVFDQEQAPLEKIFGDVDLSLAELAWSHRQQANLATDIAHNEALRRRLPFALKWFLPLFFVHVPFLWKIVESNVATVRLGEQSIMVPGLLGWFFLIGMIGPSTFFSIFRSSRSFASTRPYGPLGRYVEGWYWLPTLKIRERDFQNSNVPAQIRERRVEKDGAVIRQRALEILDRAKKENISLEIESPTRGLDGPGSALDLRDYQRRLRKPGHHRISEVPSTITISAQLTSVIRFERIPESERKTDDGALEIEYLSLRYGKKSAPTDKYGKIRFYGPVDINGNGQTKKGYEDMAGYIFQNLFGLGGGIRIIDEANLPSGLESSNITVKALIEAAAMLSGTQLSKADIWVLGEALENDVFKGVTGGQGVLSAYTGGAHEHLWFLDGDRQDQRSAFSIELVPPNQWEAFASHFVLTHLGGTTEAGSPILKRAGPLINKMWLDMLKRDEKSQHLFEEMVPLANTYALAMLHMDFKTIAQSVNRLSNIRDHLLRRWFGLMLDAKLNHTYVHDGPWWWLRLEPVPDYARAFAERIEDEDKYPEYKPLQKLLARYAGRGPAYLRTRSLYTLDPIEGFLNRVRRRGFGAMPTGAGGPGAIIAVVSPNGKAAIEDLIAIEHLDKDEYVRHWVDAGLEMRRYLDVRIGSRAEIRGFDKFVDAGVVLPQEPLRKFYDQETGRILDSKPEELPSEQPKPINRLMTFLSVAMAVLLYPISLLPAKEMGALAQSLEDSDSSPEQPTKMVVEHQQQMLTGSVTGKFLLNPKKRLSFA